MRPNSILLFLLSSLLLITPLNGCLDVLDPLLNTNTITYESHPTSIEYDISYGYIVNTSGTGSSTILCTQDTPELINGVADQLLITPVGYKNTIIANNTMVEWNDTKQGTNSITYDISTHIESNDFFIEDLSGTNAMTIDDIQGDFPDLIDTYCGVQENNETTIIDPFHPTIQQIAQAVRANAHTENSLLIAKELFIWLKNNTRYKTHLLQQEAQPASVTLQLKQGDCDDLSFLYISLCRSVGIPTRFIRGYLLDITGGSLSAVDHMWVEVFVGGTIGKDGWIPVECAGTGDLKGEVHQNFGMEDATHLRLFTGDGTNESISIASSHISVHYEQTISIDITGFYRLSNYSILKSQKLCITDSTQRAYC
jgi:hypothetical protein